MRIGLAILGLVVATMWMTLAILWLAEEEVPIVDIPERVLKAVAAKFPEGKILSATKDVEDNHPFFAVRLKSKKDRFEVIVTPGGEIEEISRDIEKRDLPKDVIDGIEKSYPAAKIKDTAEVTEYGDKVVVNYYVELLTADAKSLEVMFDGKGTVRKETNKDAKKGK